MVKSELITMGDESAEEILENFVFELCGSRAAWQATPNIPTHLQLETISARIESDGYTAILRTHLCYTFEGPASLTLYPSGKLMIKCEDRELALKIAKHHLSSWLEDGV